MDKYLGSSGKRIWTFRINFVFLQAEKQKTSIMWRSLCTVLLATLLLSSCNRYQNPRQLVEADSLLAYSADSALLLFSQWQPKLRNASDADYHYFQLLQLAAEDKTYVIHTSDSIVRALANNSSAIAKILAMYNYNKKVEEVNRLENTNRRHKMLLIVVLLSVLIVSYIVYEAWCSQRRKQTETEINFANYRSKQNQLMQISQQAIEEKNNELSRLKQKLESKDGENLNLQKQITALESEIIIAQEEKALHEKKAEKANLTIINTELYATIRQRLHNPDMSQHLTTEEWNEMDRVVNLAFDGFSEQLRQYVPKISVHEYRVSLALKFGLKIKDIAEITSHSMQALGSTRSRLYAKAFGNKGVAADWDKFISSL